MDNYDLIAQFAKEMMEKAGLDLPKSDPSKGGQTVAYVQAIADVARQYADHVTELAKAAEATTVTEQYSVKGDSTYRGYYHPSPVQELIVTNCSRGRLTGRPPLSGRYYRYGFDAEGKLTSVSRYDKKRLAAVEYFIRPQASEEYGLVFEAGAGGMLLTGTKTTFENGNPTAFCSVNMPVNLNCMNQFEYQTFSYEGERLVAVTFETGIYGMMSGTHTYRVETDRKGMRLVEDE